MHKFQLLLDDLDESMISVIQSFLWLDEKCFTEHGYWSWGTITQIKN